MKVKNMSVLPGTWSSFHTAPGRGQTRLGGQEKPGWRSDAEPVREILIKLSKLLAPSGAVKVVIVVCMKSTLRAQ